MKLPNYQPEKSLCEKSIFLSLTEKDLMALGLVYIVSHLIFRLLGLELLALLVTLMATLILIPIRIKYRPQILKDFVLFLLNQFFREGFCSFRSHKQELS